MLMRLKENFQLAINILCGVCAVVGILPFAIFRFWNGQVVAGVIDLLAVLAIVGAGVYAWTTNRTAGANLFLVGVTGFGCVAICLLLGLAGVMWAYTVVVMNFFLVARRPAVLASLTLIALICAQPALFDGLLERLSFAATASLVSLYAFIYASRTESQRLQMEALASIDALTGAGNRRLMEHELEQAVSGLRPNRPCPAAALIDLDHFKRVNDRFGHEAGDQVLVQFADIARSSLRKFDRLYRFGGEEFVLLLPATELGGLSVALEKLQLALDAGLRSPGGRVTVSIGAAVLERGEDAASWLARADAALYRAKNSGRDRIVLDDPGDSAMDDGGAAAQTRAALRSLGRRAATEALSY